ncbi:MAG: MarR family winged helix-turn-helix transcriptional regulator [Mycobacteriales bacterium]
MTATDPVLDDAVAAVRAFTLAAHRFRQAVAGHFGLTINGTVVLSHLVTAGGQLTPGQIRDRSQITSGTLSAVIDRLVEGRFVSRTPHPEDQRSVLVTLNPAGRRVLSYSQTYLKRAVLAAFQDEPHPREAAAQVWRISASITEQADRAGRRARRK